ERFQGVRLTALYSSPLERCVATIEPLAAAQNVELRLSDALAEMDTGDWTGRTLASVRRTKLWKVVQCNPSRFRFPNGESFVDAEARVLDEIERIRTRHPRGRVAIGTHGDLVRMLVSHYTGAHLDEFQRVVADPASVSVVYLGDSVPRILLVNDTGSLERFRARPPSPGTRRGSSGNGRRAGSGRKLRG
ncbi:MAG TPA: histidine phosphatase family protein, partial [Actinomycetota bacterium]|nr:histidine phosphatase family protein [Actinomycetota bacterium]